MPPPPRDQAGNLPWEPAAKQMLDAAVAGRTWLAGDHFSLADIDMAVLAGFSGWVKAKPPEELTELHTYLARVQAELG